MDWNTLFKDFRGQLSWGRIVSFCALVVAIVGTFHGMTVDMLKAWLTIVLGGYGSSKATEAITSFRNKDIPSGGGDQ
jgi:hypothetical protein